MKSKLRKCPFCGGKVSMIGHNKFYMVQCNKCNAMTSFRAKITQKECAELWNKRILDEDIISDYAKAGIGWVKNEGN